ncbi:MAG TPA: copper chaperone PCu(A)C, partial [Cryobacterium sp.]|nr:copper chaperone PCu(A)C [Cryobacterium sp.]
HETVANDAGDMVMQEKPGGFVVPAGGSIELAPGGSHIMLMGLTGPLAAGDEATFTLTLDDGSSLEFSAPVKDYTGANETYKGDTEMDMDTDKE